MSIYAQVQDIEDGWDRRFTIAEVTKVQTLLDRAERKIANRIDIAARIASGLTTPENVQDALVEMVRRVLRNPGGYRQQATGPFSATLDRAVASGRLEINSEERRLLGMISGSGSVGIEDPALPGLFVESEIDA